MHFQYFTTLIVGFATISVADHMTVNEEYGGFGQYDRSDAIFFTDYGAYRVNANNGCRGTSVPGMTDFCVDWARTRGHFKYSHQDFKRCMIVTSRTGYPCLASECQRYEFGEVGCSWRLAEGNSSDTVPVSETPLPTAVPKN